VKNRTAAIILAGVLGLAASGCERGRDSPVSGGDSDRGRAAILKYGCSSCHSIPGIREGNSVGPPLDSYSRRPRVADTLPNTPDNLTLFLLDPASVRPGTAMPDVGLSTDEARDITAFLYTLR
jgi:cytochrome c